MDQDTPSNPFAKFLVWLLAPPIGALLRIAREGAPDMTEEEYLDGVRQMEEARQKRESTRETGVVAIRKSDGRKAIKRRAGDFRKPWLELPPGLDPQLGAVLTYLLPDGATPEEAEVVDFDPSEVPVDTPPPNHPDQSGQIDLTTVTIRGRGLRVTAHHPWQQTVDELRAFHAPPWKTLTENLTKTGWVYGIPFGHHTQYLKNGSILFDYDAGSNTIHVFHSFDQPSG